MTRCVITQDEHANAKGLAPARAFPAKPYLECLCRHWQQYPLLRVEKSRQIMVTWLMIGLHLWAALKHPGERIAYQAKKFDDADNYLRDRWWWIYKNIPAVYELPRARYVYGAIEVYHDQSTIPTSQIMALAQGPEQFRQYTFSRIFSDEFAFQEHQDESYAAMRPTIDGGGRCSLVSSANGDRNLFYELGHKDITG